MDKQQVEEAMRGLGPAAKGSLSEVRKPCGRPGCRICRDEGGHRAFLFHCADGERRRCMYVPAALEPTVREALRVGRLAEEVLHGGGPALILAHRRRKAGGGS
jgi:hypothetical protein